MTEPTAPATEDRRRTRVDRRSIGWGGFFVGLGAVPLAAAVGLGLPSAIGDLAGAWPLLLVVIGLALIVQWTPIGALGSLAAGLVIGVFVGGVVAGGAGGPGCLLGRAVGSGASPSGTFTGPTATVDLNVACSDLQVRPMPGLSWRIGGLGPSSSDAVTSDDGSMRLVTTTSSGSASGTSISADLPTGTRLDLGATDRFGSLTMDLPGAQLGRLSVRTDFARAEVDLGGATLQGPIDLRSTFGSASLRLPEGPLTGTARSDFGSLSICLPAGTPVRLTTRAAFGSVSVVGPGLISEGDVWQSVDAGTVDSRIDLDLQTNFGSIDVTRGGC